MANGDPGILSALAGATGLRQPTDLRGQMPQPDLSQILAVLQALRQRLLQRQPTQPRLPNEIPFPGPAGTSIGGVEPSFVQRLLQQLQTGGEMSLDAIQDIPRTISDKLSSGLSSITPFLRGQLPETAIPHGLGLPEERPVVSPLPEPQGDIDLPFEGLRGVLAPTGQDDLPTEEPIAPPTSGVTAGMMGPGADMLGEQPPLSSTPIGGFLSPPTALMQTIVKEPGLWGQFAHSLLGGLTENLVPAIVAFAAQRTNSPEVVQAFSDAQARKLRQAELLLQQHVAEAQMVQDAFGMQRMLENLNLSRVNAARQLFNQATQIHKDVSVDNPAAAIKMWQGLAQLAGSVGIEPQSFLDAFPLPTARILHKMNEDVDKLMEKYQDWELVKKMGIMMPGSDDPELALSAEEVRQANLELGDDGVVHAPIGLMDFRDVTTRTAGGQEITETRPLADVLGRKFIKERAPQTFTTTVESPFGTKAIHVIEKGAKGISDTAIDIPQELGGMGELPRMVTEFEAGSDVEDMRKILKAVRRSKKDFREPRIEDIQRALETEEGQLLLKEYRTRRGQ